MGKCLWCPSTSMEGRFVQDGGSFCREVHFSGLDECSRCKKRLDVGVHKKGRLQGVSKEETEDVSGGRVVCQAGSSLLSPIFDAEVFGHKGNNAWPKEKENAGLGLVKKNLHKPITGDVGTFFSSRSVGVSSQMDLGLELADQNCLPSWSR